MPERYSVGLVQEPSVDVEHVVCLVLVIGRCVQYVSGPSPSCGGGAYGQWSSGCWVPCPLEFAYVAGCSLLGGIKAPTHGSRVQ